MIDKRPTPTWKRIIDLGASSAMLVAASPIMVGVALAHRCLMGSPTLYRQERPGHGGEPFHILKFRTMIDRRDADGGLLPDSERRHWFGDLLRSTSLDELPSLFNVFRGEMSFVGPRPLLPQYLDRYTARQARRHEVVPGLTGLAQVNGRNALDWDYRLELDVQYVENQSLTGDLRILYSTVFLVLRRTGANGIDHTTEFMGSGAA